MKKLLALVLILALILITSVALAIDGLFIEEVNDTLDGWSAGAVKAELTEDGKNCAIFRRVDGGGYQVATFIPVVWCDGEAAVEVAELNAAIWRLRSQLSSWRGFVSWDAADGLE